MIQLLILVTCITFSMRFLPFLCGKKLNSWPILQKASQTLPACLTLLLVAQCVESTHFGLNEALALSTVTLFQVFFRTILLSMMMGVFAHQVFLNFL